MVAVIQILQGLLAMFEIGICSYFVIKIMEDDWQLTRGYKVILSANVIFLGTMLTISRNRMFFSEITFFSEIIFTSVVILLRKKENIGMKICLVSFGYLFLACMDFFFAFMSMILLEPLFEEPLHWYSSPIWCCLILFCSRLFWFRMMWYLKNISDVRKYLYESRKVIFIINIILFLVIIQCDYQFITMVREEQEMEGGKVGLSLLLLLMVIVFVIDLLFKQKMLQKENEILLLREEMQKQNYVELENAFRENRRLIHDIKNHFLILKKLEKENKYDQIRDYIEEIEKNYVDVETQIWTANEIIDFLLIQKKEEAKKKGIFFEIEATPIHDLRLKDSELCSLFGNLLDNAIEACQKSNKKIIQVKIRKQKQLTFIQIRNTLLDKPIMSNGQFVSTKTEKGIHGLGIRNVMRIVQKYEGVISFEVDDNWFDVRISFFDVK